MTRLYSVDPHKPSATVHWDWLTAVIPIPKTQAMRSGEDVVTWVNRALNDLCLNCTWLPMSHGLYTYKSAMSSADASIIVAWTDEDIYGEVDSDATFMIQMSGAGVESAESIFASYVRHTQGDRVTEPRTVAWYISQVVNVWHGTFSRVDACCNFFNYGKEYSARYAGEEALAGHLVTRSSRIKLIRSASAKGGCDTDEAYTGLSEGYTTYVGNNPKQLRIYNKLAERSDKVNQHFMVDSWSRWEFQLNGEHAKRFVDAFLTEQGCNLPDTWTTWLATNYRWIEEVGHQSKRSRYPNAKWYDRIVQNRNGEIKLRTEKQNPTLERATQWVDDQVMSTLATIYYARYKKYLLNGLSEEDAKKLAITFITGGIDNKITNDDLNMTKVDTWIQEQEETGY